MRVTSQLMTLTLATQITKVVNTSHSAKAIKSRVLPLKNFLYRYTLLEVTWRIHLVRPGVALTRLEWMNTGLLYKLSRTSSTLIKQTISQQISMLKITFYRLVPEREVEPTTSSISQRESNSHSLKTLKTLTKMKRTMYKMCNQAIMNMARTI